jgi:hypothetical protein
MKLASSMPAHCRKEACVRGVSSLQEGGAKLDGHATPAQHVLRALLSLLYRLTSCSVVVCMPWADTNC